MQQSTGSNSTQTTEVLHPDSIRTIAITTTLADTQKNPTNQPVLSATSTTPSLVTDAPPILPSDPYPIQHGTRINETPQNNPLNRVPDFTRTYAFDGNATGMIINVTKGPLVLSFVVTPKYDCMMDPESCKGSLAASVNRPWMTITVRDNQTHEIVAEDGYGREFSSDNGHYEFIITSRNEDGTTSTTTTTPGPRRIVIYKEGQFHVTLTGAYLDTTLSVATGASSSASDTQSSSSTPTPVQIMSPEYLRYLQQSGGAV
jgi:hypothetical protein